VRRVLEIHVAGTGSFALEVVEYARAAGHEVTALVELLDATRIGSRIHGLPVLGADSEPATVVLGIGRDRLAHWAGLAEKGWEAASVLHPAAHVSPSARLGPGCVVGPAAVIGAATQVGPQVLVGRGALVGHHVLVEAGAVVNPGANVAGNARIGVGAVVGMGAAVGNGIEVGERALVAAGAVVVRPVAPETRVQGVPARIFSTA
jgi:sugar O-acyltransferase (sialic acid O-acetyltransferase NeuD family)